jgi:hypothetical protein
MPGAGPGQAKDWYCDANDVGGEACPEIDLLEMNQHALHTTMHSCKHPYSKANCDGGGYGARWERGIDTLEDCGPPPGVVGKWRGLLPPQPFVLVRFGQGASDFGVGPSFTIDTSRPFELAFAFQRQGSHIGLAINVSQVTGTERRTIHGGIEDCSSVQQPLAQGMVLVFSFWGSTSMGWLDSPPCSSDPATCPSQVTFSNLTLNTLE